MLSEMKPSKALRQFQKLYWDDLTPEQINYIGQSIGEVAQLEAELENQKHESNRLYGVGQEIDELRVKEVAQLEADNTALLRYVRAYKANVEWKSDSNQAKVVVARQALSDETQKAIEDES